MVKHSTITGNRALLEPSIYDNAAGGGIYLTSGGAMTLDHTIVAGNSAISGRDLANDSSSGFLAIYSMIGIGADFLEPLADNGGPTFTHALLPGSPAIDAGDPNAVPGVGTVPLFDQRGSPYTRVFDGDGAGGARIDIGAVEFIPIDAIPTLFGDYNRNGVVDAADYTVWRNALGQTGLTPYSGADGNGDGKIDAVDYDVWRSHFGQTVAPPAAGAGASLFAIAASNLDVSEPVTSAVAETTAPTIAANSVTSPSWNFTVASSGFTRHDLGHRSATRIHTDQFAASVDDQLLVLLANDRLGAPPSPSSRSQTTAGTTTIRTRIRIT